MFFVRVQHEDKVRQTAHVADTVQGPHQLFMVTGHHQRFFLGKLSEVLGSHNPFNIAHSLDRLGNRLPVCQHTARPAVIDIVLAAALGGFSNLFRSSPLCANEQHPATLGHSRRNRLERAIQHRARLIEVDDVNTVAGTKDERSHLRIPAAGIVTKVNASFHELTQRERRRCHRFFPSGLNLHANLSQTFLPQPGMPACV